MNTLTGGIPGNTELSVLDWTDQSHEDYVFGKVLGKAKRVDLPRMIEDAYLKEGWSAHQGGEEDGVLLFYDESVVENRYWTAEQVRPLYTTWKSFCRLLPFSTKVWGFAELKGERRHVRRIRMTGRDKKVRCFQLVYDYRECILAGPVLETHVSQSGHSEDDLDNFAYDQLDVVVDFR